MSRHFEAIEHTRKLVVCIGGPAVCNILEPRLRGYSPIWPSWVRMLTTAARANVAIYAVMPVHPTSRILIGGGQIAITGGDGFSNKTDFDRFIDALWQEAGEYYLLGYWPPPSPRELRSVSVSVARKGVHVRARTVR
jgi:hypothetical protein